MRPFRSLLFVPGARPDRFDKALAAGADAVCIDLEDAVAPKDKDAARRSTFAFLATPSVGCSVGFRVNALSTLEAFRDVIAYSESAAQPAFIMIPKARSGAELRNVRSALGDRCPPLWPLVEGPDALSALAEIAAAAAPSGGVMLGGVDYAAALGAELGWDALYHARACLVAATSAAGCGAIDAPYLATADLKGLEAETRRVRAMGFTGRACIHPGQVETINRVFTPSDAEISKAEKIAAAFKEAEGGVALLDGTLVEKPVHQAAQRLIARRGEPTP
ncbi:MAG: CoA ester lyase [Parvularculaceae bacterium]|nr:CoA ester lyase [Parvularculaceae bacterium]